MVKASAQSAKRGALKPPATPTAGELAAAELAEAERVEAERVEAERVEAERVEAERVEAERTNAVERRRHPVLRDIEHDRMPFSPDSETLPAFEQVQFEQLKLVGAVAGDWADGEAVDV